MNRTNPSLSFVFAVVLAIAALAQGCGGKSCVDLCTQSQAGSCTSVRGNCSNFCTALGAVKGPAMCSTAYDEYQTCLSAGTNTCDNACGSQETTLTNCVTAYCVGHSSDTNCTTLAASF